MATTLIPSFQQRLQSQVKGFLQSAGYSLLDEGDGFLALDQQQLAGKRDIRLIWIVPPSTEVEDFRQLQHRLLRSFSEMVSRYPEARPNTLIAPSREGYSAEFQAELKQYNIDFRVPVQFFDTSFRLEAAPEIRSVISGILNETLSETRIEQPWASAIANDSLADGDVLPFLLDRCAVQGAPRLTVVVAPAGAGKTVLFRSLFTELYRRFQDSKRRGQLGRRPIPFAPELLPPRTGSPRINEVFDEFIRSEMTARIDREAFKWLVRNGYTNWLFDGLDEMYAGSPDFSDELLDLITDEGSDTNIAVFARDSLLTSPTGFGEFVREYAANGGEVISVVRLKEWGRAQKRLFAWVALEGAIPGPSGSSSAVEELVERIEGTQILRDLSGIPFYLSQMVKEFGAGRLDDIRSEHDLVERFIESMVVREQDKGIFNERYYSAGDVRAWLEAAAMLYYESGFSGIPVSDLREYAEAVVRERLMEDEREQAVLSLLRFPFFSAAGQYGMIRFNHELISEHLAASNLGLTLETNPAGVAQRLGDRIDLWNSTIARELSNIARGKHLILHLIETLQTKALPGRAFGNLLQVLMLADPAADLIQRNRLVLERRDLSFVRFLTRDLRGISFRSAVLEGTVFDQCELADAKFEGAHLIGTRFCQVVGDTLRGAAFGDLERLDHFYIGSKHYADYHAARAVLAKATGIPPVSDGPCPSALQLRELFHKFVHFNGQPRRLNLAERALVRGTRHHGAPAAETVLEAAKKNGYVEGPDFRRRYQRPSGDAYGEMSVFVGNLELSVGLRRLLDGVCDRTDCKHVV